MRSTATTTTTANNDSRTTPSFKEWHSISLVLPEIKQSVGLGPTKPRNINGWVLLAIVIGVDEACSRLTNSLDTVSIVSGLLIVAAITMVASPNDQVTEMMEHGNEWTGPIPFQAFFHLCSLASLMCHFFAIAMGSFLGQAVRVAARDTDRYRVLLARHTYPTWINLVFTFGCASFSGLIAVSIAPYTGLWLSIVYAALIFGFTGLFPHWVNRYRLMNTSHPVHGWYAKHSNEYVLHHAMYHLEQLAEIDRNAWKTSPPPPLPPPPRNAMMMVQDLDEDDKA